MIDRMLRLLLWLLYETDDWISRRVAGFYRGLGRFLTGVTIVRIKVAKAIFKAGVWLSRKVYDADPQNTIMYQMKGKRK